MVAISTTEQASSGSTLLTLDREGARKSALKIACLKPPVRILTFIGITDLWSEI